MSLSQCQDRVQGSGCYPDQAHAFWLPRTASLWATPTRLPWLSSDSRPGLAYGRQVGLGY